MELNYTLKEKGETLQLHFLENELTCLPLKVVMKSLELLENSNRRNGFFVEFDKKTQSFIDKNKELYEQEVKQEGKEFKNFSDVYFKALVGPLYVYGSRVLEIVNSVYEKEVFFNEIKEQSIPKVLYTLKKEENSNSDKVLVVKNLEELIEKFGKAITLNSLVLFKDHLNYEFQIQNDTDKAPYGISSQILVGCFNEEKGVHEVLETFNGRDYILEQLFNDQCKKVKNPEDIFQLVLIKESVRVSSVESNSVKKNKNKV